MTFLTTLRAYPFDLGLAATPPAFVSKLRQRHHSETRSKSPGAPKAANPNLVRLTVDHLTEYRYARPVSFGEHSLYLRPRESQTIHVESFELDTNPEGKIRWVRDCFNNVVAVVSFGAAEASLLSIRCRMAFDVAEENPFDFILEGRANEFPFAYDDREKSALEPYLRPEESERWPVLDWARDALGDPAQPRATISFLTDLNMAIHRRIVTNDSDRCAVRNQSWRLRGGVGEETRP